MSAEGDDNETWDEVDASLEDDINPWDDVPLEDDIDPEASPDATDFDAGDVLGKGLGLVNQVSYSQNLFSSPILI